MWQGEENRQEIADKPKREIGTLESQTGFREPSVLRVWYKLILPQRAGIACPVPATYGWCSGVPGGEELLRPKTEHPAARLPCCRAAVLSPSPDFFHQKLLRDCTSHLCGHISFSAGLEGERATSPLGELWATPASWEWPVRSFALLRLGMVFAIENLRMRISEAKATLCMEVKYRFIFLHTPCHRTVSKYVPSTWLCSGMRWDGWVSGLPCLSHIRRGEEGRKLRAMSGKAICSSDIL